MKILKRIIQQLCVCNSNSRRKREKKKSEIHLSLVNQAIYSLSEDIVKLYDIIEDYFFQDVNYQIVQSFIPMWMMDTGRSPESGMDKETFEKLRCACNDPMSNRILFWFDIQNLLASTQDRIVAVTGYLQELYQIVPAYSIHKTTEYTSATRGLNETSDKAHTCINNVFTSLASSFDLLSKIVYECHEYDPTNFSTYNKLKSRKNGILYKKSLRIYSELKQEGLLFNEANVIRKVCTFRDEFIHNGSWDYRCAIYEPWINDEPVESFILAPDTDDTGVLLSSGGRNKFYTQEEKINVTLPYLVEDVIAILKDTILCFKQLLKDKTIEPKTTDVTNEYISRLISHQELFSKILATKGV